LAVREACGIFGACSPNPEYRASYAVYNGLVSVQHRGQDCCGICVHDSDGLSMHKGVGLVSDVFSRTRLDSLTGNAAIGHVRYPTTGSGDLKNAQPFMMSFRNNDFAFSFNGNIANYPELRKELMEKGHTFVSTTEIEVIGMLFSTALNKPGARSEDAAREVMSRLDGSYSIIALDARGKLYAIRDPQGFKPFVYGKDAKGTWFFSSESCALDALGVRDYKDVKPGEMVKVSPGREPAARQVVEPKLISHCMFEFLYFARGDSVIDGRLCNEVRRKLGEALARKHPAKADVVVPVPDSGKSFAIGYSRESGIPYDEGLMKNRYIFRTFIMPEQEMREKAVRAKLNPVRKAVEGKRIVLVEDSIVRGTTLTAIVKMLREAGAAEVHVRVGCPPVIAPCYMGMDFPTYRELLAANHTVDEIKGIIGADSLGYSDLESLGEAIGLPGQLCMACLTGLYPLKKCPAKGAKITCC
jgi:amidophosphoribosyltransferase